MPTRVIDILLGLLSVGCSIMLQSGDIVLIMGVFWDIVVLVQIGVYAQSRVNVTWVWPFTTYVFV